MGLPRTAPSRWSRLTCAVRIFLEAWRSGYVRKATSAALLYTRRRAVSGLAESTRPVQPTSTQPQPPGGVGLDVFLLHG